MHCMLKAFALMVLFSALVMAQPASDSTIPTTGTLSVSIDKVHVVGRGLAVNPSEATDFKLVKIIVATITIHELEEEFGLGVMFIDDKKYKLTNIEKTETTASGDIYDGKTKVGTFSLTKVKKLDVEVWAGTITISDQTLFAYIMGVARHFKPEETGDKIDEFCMKNPEKCAGASKEECTRNPMAEPCQRVMREYCAANQDDIRCRGQMGDYCQQNAGAPECGQAIPELKCLQCIRPYAEACGLTNEKCGWDKVTETNPPTCGPPTQEEQNCMMQSKDMMVACGAACGMARQQVTTVAEPEYVAPVGGQVCRKEVKEVCEEVQYAEPVGSISCEEAQARNCQYKCLGQDGRVDEGCMFGCKSGAIRQCGTTAPIMTIAPQFGKPCMPPYMCGNKADLERQNCSEIADFSCGQSGVVCMKCPQPPIAGGYMCPAYWEPVCGMDGKTYPNPCQLKAAGAQFKYNGECGGQPIPPATYCGNHVCEPQAGETSQNCYEDCYAPPSGNVTPTLKPNGAMCAYGGECQSGYCMNGYCSSQPVPPPTTSACSDGTPVGSCSSVTPMYRCNAFTGYNNLVYDTSCAGSAQKPVGASCTYHSDCQSTYCVNGVCSSTPANRPLGSPCMATVDCMTPYVCISSVCSTSTGGGMKPLGSPCTSPGECFSGQCPAGTCSQGVKTAGMYCMYAEECAVGFACMNGACSSTTTPTMCSDGTGIGACSAQQSGYRCNLLGTSPNQYTNLVYDASCISPGTKPLGASCTTTSECMTPYMCINSICSSLKADGQACTLAGECQGSYCNNGYCSSAPLKSSGSPCASSYECASNICSTTNMTCA